MSSPDVGLVVAPFSQASIERRRSRALASQWTLQNVLYFGGERLLFVQRNSTAGVGCWGRLLSDRSACRSKRSGTVLPRHQCSPGDPGAYECASTSVKSQAREITGRTLQENERAANFSTTFC